MIRVTLDEAIRHCEELVEQEECFINYPHSDIILGDLDIESRKHFVAEQRQLEKWLTELKEAKRLLKAAVEDFRISGTMLDDGHGHCTAEIGCDECVLGGGNLADDCQWRHEAEVLKLIGEGGDPGD